MDGGAEVLSEQDQGANKGFLLNLTPRSSSEQGLDGNIDVGTYIVRGFVWEALGFYQSNLLQE